MMATLQDYLKVTKKLNDAPKDPNLADWLLGRVKPEQIREPDVTSTEFIRNERETLYGKLDR